MNILVSELAELIGADFTASGDEAKVTGFASLKDARQGDVSFFSDHRYRDLLAATKASVVLVPHGWTELPSNVVGLTVADPSTAFEKVVKKHGFHPTLVVAGIHPTAVVETDPALLGKGVFIGAKAVVEAGAVIGDDVQIGAGCYVGHGVKLGNGTRLYPNVTVQEGCEVGQRVLLHSGVVIGADGFGYEFVNGEHRKIPQSGIVQIDDDVEIGANTTVDRAKFGRTWIGKGTKIDNLVQIAHNVTIGKHCIVVSGTGIAGSAQIGDYVVIGAQAGIAGHVTIGSMCTIAGRAGVTKDIPAGRAAYMGFPAGPASEEKRRIVAVRQLPELIARVKKLERGENVSTQ